MTIQPRQLFTEVGLMTAPGEEERRRERPQVCSVGSGFLVLQAPARAGQRSDRCSQPVHCLGWLAEGPASLASGGDWAPARHLLLSLGTLGASGITRE